MTTNTGEFRKSFKTVIIEISGGCLSKVSNLPEGWDYYLVDHDDRDDEDEIVERKAGEPWVCPVCGYSNVSEDGNSECGNCTVEFVVHTVENAT